MVIIPTRRATLVAGVNTILAFTGDIHPDARSTVSPSSLEDFICNYTPKNFRDAVAVTGRFLYRGEVNIHKPMILAPEPDLLIPGTYDDPGALINFQCLEKRLLNTGNILARPSLGHIATSDKSEAAQWGEAVSIWPIGRTLSFVWPRHRKVFCPTSTTCLGDEIAINHELAVALELGHEVLFASMLTNDGEGLESSFLAVPAEFESVLVQLAKKPAFTSYQD